MSGTTVNVQHLESLNDLVYQITGVRQRETLPDQVFDEATEIELIDLRPVISWRGCERGKSMSPMRWRPRWSGSSAPRISWPCASWRCARLRHVSRQLRALFQSIARGPGSRGDRVLVAVGPDEQAEQLVRSGKRMADALDAAWTVVYVETPELLRLSDAERNRRIDVLRLAESLGAETVTLDGPSAAAVLLEYAQTRNARV